VNLREIPRIISALVLCAAALVAGCATSPAETRYATVIGISQYQRNNPETQLVGAVGGGLVGGLLGSQIGGGTGRAVATVVGAVAGGYVGSEIASKHDRETAYEITYRYDNGEVGTLTLRSKPGVRIGQRVRVYPDWLEPA
jgi:outer membrane lipoprotein SlyB